MAVSLLNALADDARSFRDQALRARVEARAGDALWETDPDKARTLFRRAWEEAETADAESAKKQAEDMQGRRSVGGPIVISRPRDIRSEVLRIVAKRDRDLGEEFLKKLSDADEVAKNDDRRNMDSSESSIAASKRLQLAKRLLDDGETERALQFAAPVLDTVSRDTITFLSLLREKTAPAADQIFLSLLTRTESNPSADANTVSGLSSYAFTPFFYLVFSPDGGASMSQERRDTAAPDLPPAIRATFFRVASEVLLRPLPPPDQDSTTSGRAGRFLVIKRLLPLFEQYAPEQAQILKTQVTALTGDVPENLRTGENRALTRGITPDDASRNPLDRMQERLDHARTAEERDAIYADYAVTLAGKGDPRTHDLIDKISDSELRKNVLAYVDFQLAQQAINKKDATEAARLAKYGELNSTQRVWIYSRAAKLLMKDNRSQALDLLDDAAAEARRISGGNADRARALVAVATVLYQADRVRAWEMLTEALKAANATEGFTGEDSSVSAMLRSSQMVMVTNASAEEFDLAGIFGVLAKENLNRSIELAKSFSAESPRAVATLAIARAMLEKNRRASSLE
jgi:hypothetical protein